MQLKQLNDLIRNPYYSTKSSFYASENIFQPTENHNTFIN